MVVIVYFCTLKLRTCGGKLVCVKQVAVARKLLAGRENATIKLDFALLCKSKKKHKEDCSWINIFLWTQSDYKVSCLYTKASLLSTSYSVHRCVLLIFRPSLLNPQELTD